MTARWWRRAATAMFCLTHVAYAALIVEAWRRGALALVAWYCLVLFAALTAMAVIQRLHDILDARLDKAITDCDISKEMLERIDTWRVEDAAREGVPH